MVRGGQKAVVWWLSFLYLITMKSVARQWTPNASGKIKSHSCDLPGSGFMTDSHRGWLSSWAGCGSRLTHFVLKTITIVAFCSDIWDCSERGSNISGAEWWTAITPPTLEFMQHSVWKAVTTLMTMEERRGEKDLRKQLGWQGDDWVDCACFAAHWPLPLENRTMFHPCFMYTWGHQFSQEHQRFKKKFHRGYFLLSGSGKTENE